MNKNKISDAVCIIASAVLALMSVIAIIRGESTGYEINTGFLCAIFCLVPMLMRLLNWVTLPLPLILMIELSIFLHAYGVLLLRYDLIAQWDTITHTISSITVALCVFYALLTVNAFDPDSKFTAKSMPLFILLIMLTFATYWEVFELLVDEFTGTNMQYSPFDTIRDLICDLFGALVISIYAFSYMSRNTWQGFITSLNIHPKVTKLILPFRKD